MLSRISWLLAQTNMNVEYFTLFLFFFLLSGVQCLYPLAANASNVTALPPLPPDFVLRPKPGLPLHIDVAQAAHLLLLVVDNGWKATAPGNGLNKSANAPNNSHAANNSHISFSDVDFPWKFGVLFLPSAEEEYGNLIVVAWAALRVVAANIEAMGPHDLGWRLPSRGYSMERPPFQIGGCVIRPHTDASSSSLTTNNASQLLNMTKQIAPLPRLPRTGLEVTTLQDTGYTLVILQGSRVVPKKAVIQLLFDYLDTVWAMQSTARLASSMQRGQTWTSPRQVLGWELQVRYTQVIVNRRRVLWSDIVQAIRFLLRDLAGHAEWKGFVAYVRFAGGTTEFLTLNMRDVVAEPPPPRAETPGLEVSHSYEAIGEEKGTTVRCPGRLRCPIELSKLPKSKA